VAWNADMNDEMIEGLTVKSCAVDGSCCGPWSSCCDEYDPDYVLSITVENATGSDLAEVQRLLSANELPLDGVADFIDHFLVARAAGRIVGCIGLERYGSSALLRSAAVRKDLHGRGVGAQLVSALLARARGEGIETIYLLTTTAPEYFARVGFERIDRGEIAGELNASAELKGACPASAVVMRQRIGKVLLA
jgi:amino-acid N-acetyltransferase